jgi:hypothetical protein
MADGLESERSFSVSVDHIGVAVRDRVVTLSRDAESFIEKFAFERTARRVRAVTQKRVVHLTSDRETAEAEIAVRAVKISDSEALVLDDRIPVQMRLNAKDLSFKMGEMRDWLDENHIETVGFLTVTAQCVSSLERCKMLIHSRRNSRKQRCRNLTT